MKPRLLWRGFETRGAPNPIDPRLLRHPAVFIASLGGAGLSPIAPGTIGTLLGLPLGWSVAGFAALPAFALFAILLAIGTWAAARTDVIVGRHDDSIIVCDETVAMALVVLCIPKTATTLLAGFLLFRFFDSVKPWPANLLERRAQNGFGVMADDFVAAAYTIATIQMAVSAITRFTS